MANKEDQELLERVQQKISQNLKNQNEIIEEEEKENELDVMKRILMAEIRKEDFPHKIKRHFQLYFGIPQESPEKLQLDQLMLKQDLLFDKMNATLKEEIHDLKDEFNDTKRDLKFTRWGLIALAFAIAGIEYLPDFLRIMGFP